MHLICHICQSCIAEHVRHGSCTTTDSWSLQLQVCDLWLSLSSQVDQLPPTSTTQGYLDARNKTTAFNGVWLWSSRQSSTTSARQCWPLSQGKACSHLSAHITLTCFCIAESSMCTADINVCNSTSRSDPPNATCRLNVPGVIHATNMALTEHVHQPFRIHVHDTHDKVMIMQQLRAHLTSYMSCFGLQTLRMPSDSVPRGQA